MSESSAVKKYAAELIGTLVLVMMGCGSAVLAARDFGIQPSGLAGIGTVGIAFAFGLSLLAMVYAIGGISGCHINPAVTISMLAAGKISVKDAVAYIIVQCVGATIGAALLYSIAVGLPTYSLSVNGLGQNGFDAASPAG
jgi:aquaporin Z